ncbi:MAG: hypothetical protein ACOYOV_11135 [Bacteroidales bacterium]
MKRFIIKYTFMIKNGLKGVGQLYASIARTEEDEELKAEALIEARRDFYEDNGFYACFDVLELEVTSVIVAE